MPPAGPGTLETATRRVVILATGGTIAGAAGSATAHTGYRAGALSPQQLVAAVPALQGAPLEAEAVAALDSSDMDHATWLRLARRAALLLARPEVAGLVVTHGTDTLEETAWFLHRVLAPAHKPLVLTAAMRPATALSADGPQNLLDAVELAGGGMAGAAGARGVLAVLNGRVWAGADLRKVHGYRVEAFDGGDAGPLAAIEDGALRRFRDWPQAPVHPGAARLLDAATAPDAVAWPVVDIVTSHAGARGAALEALVAAGAQGVVIAGTGNGSVHQQLLHAAARVRAAGVPVRRASRCQLGGVVGAGSADQPPAMGPLTAVQARVELMLDLLAGTAQP